MARTYRRDARGRFASGGYSGQTGGRGARLMAKNVRQGGGARMQAAGPKGTIGKPRGLKPGAIKPKPQVPKQSAGPKFEKVTAGRRRAVLPSGRAINIHDNGRQFSATLVGKDGSPRMSRRGFRNVSEAKRWAKNPNARGPRLMGRMGAESEALPRLDGIRRKGRGPSNTVRKPRGLKPQPVSASRVKAGDRQSALGKVAQRRSMGAIASKAHAELVAKGLVRPLKNRTVKGARVRGTVRMGEKAKVNHYLIQGGQRVAARAQSKAIRAHTANKVAPSPRRLDPAEQAYMQIKSQRSKFRSDAKVRAEMQRRGFLKGAKDPQDALMRVARSARLKKGSPY